MAENIDAAKKSKNKKNTEEKVEVFVTKNRKPIAFGLIALVVIALAVSIFVVVRETVINKDLAAIDSIEFTMIVDSDGLDDAATAERQNAALEALKPYMSKKSVAGVRANYFAAGISFQKKDYEAALAQYLAAVNAGKKAYTASICYFNAGVCAEELNDNAKAIEMYTKASEDKEFLLVTHALFSLARVKENTGDFEGAATVYKQLTEKYSGDKWSDVAESRLIFLAAEGKVSE